MDWTRTEADKAFDWVTSNIGRKVSLIAGSQKNYWYFTAHQAVINGCSPIMRLEFGLLDGGGFVAQFDPTTLAVAYRKEGTGEAFSFESAGPDFFWVGVATSAELLRDTSLN
jgi:hypothetical protein